LQSVDEFRCYDNMAANAKCQRVLVLALCLVTNSTITADPIIVLQPFFPDRPDLSYNLRRRPHCNKSLKTKTVDLSNNDYIIRATYKDSY